MVRINFDKPYLNDIFKHHKGKVYDIILCRQKGVPQIQVHVQRMKQVKQTNINPLPIK